MFICIFQTDVREYEDSLLVCDQKLMQIQARPRLRPNLKVIHEAMKGGRVSSFPLTTAETPNSL